MSLARNITRGTVLVNSTRMPDAFSETKLFGIGEFVGGLANAGAAAITAPVQQQAITAAERQAELDRAAKAQRQQQVLKFLGGTVVTVGIIAILIAIIR